MMNKEWKIKLCDIENDSEEYSAIADAALTVIDDRSSPISIVECGNGMRMVIVYTHHTQTDEIVGMAVDRLSKLSDRGFEYVN